VEFEWDPEKAAANIRRRRVGFNERPVSVPRLTHFRREPAALRCPSQ